MSETNNGGANPQGGAGAPAPANPNPATPAPAGGAPAGGGEGGNGGGNDETSKLKAEIVRLGGLVNGYAEKEKQRQAEIDKQKEDDAKKNGEMEKLYTETKTNFEKTSGELTTAQEALKTFDEHFGKEVDSALSSLDKETKTAIEPFLAPLANNFEKAKALP